MVFVQSAADFLMCVGCHVQEQIVGCCFRH